MKGQSIMWQSEYMIHEHRKDMLRIADQARLARLVRAERPPITRWLTHVFAIVRRPPMIELETQRPCPPPCAEMGRVS
jgi:hypothetical protein